MSPQQEHTLAWLSVTSPSVIPRGLTGAEARLREVEVRGTWNRQVGWTALERRRQLWLMWDGRLTDRIWYVGIRGRPGYSSYTPLSAFLLAEVCLSLLMWTLKTELESLSPGYCLPD